MLKLKQWPLQYCLVGLYMYVLKGRWGT